MKKILSLSLAFFLCLFSISCSFAVTVTFGAYEYEPISWIVLSSNSEYTRLLSQYALDCRLYDKSSSEWKSSDLCSWLNNSFMYSAFSSSERQALVPIENAYILIPSIGDITNPQFWFSPNKDAKDPSRIAIGSPTAIEHGLWVDPSGCCSYYTRSSSSAENVYQVRPDGSIGIARVDRDNVGIRVMIIVKTSELPSL